MKIKSHVTSWTDGWEGWKSLPGFLTHTPGVLAPTGTCTHAVEHLKNIDSFGRGSWSVTLLSVIV